MARDPGWSTLSEFILDVGAEHADADAVVLPSGRIRYSQWLAGARIWAGRLATIGVAPGEHVGILLPNGTEFMQVLFGIALAGAVAVPLNARYRGAELAATVLDAELVAVVTGDGDAGAPRLIERLHDAFPQLASQADLCHLDLADAPCLRCVVTLESGIAAAPITLPVPGPVSTTDTAVILYTSGSTSRPKGCLLSHRALLLQGQLMAARYRMQASDRIWSPVPMFHVGGISPFIAIASVGGAFLSMPRIDAGPGLALMARERATIAYVLFQTIITDLLQHPDFETSDLGAVRLMISNLALQPSWIAALLARKMPQAVQIGTFGLTESAGAACTHAPDDSAADRLHRLGRPLPGVSVRIIGEDGRDLPVGDIGEVLLRGPTLCHGYHRDADRTAATLQDGWLRTGDRGSLDAHGSVLFHGRLKDVLKVGGENVGALEVESVVGDHPAVKGCAVVGMDDPRLVEVPVTFVELKPGASATEREILDFCIGRLASFKLPRRVFFIRDWPMSATKIDKPALRRLVVELLASGPREPTH
jgi:fatty-acyl-CoA synthase/long-chain acyl-CoA synthetase